MTNTGTLSVAEVLDRAADLIEPEGRWTQGAFARGQGGWATPAMSSNAVCFCLRGALIRVGAVHMHSEQSRATRALGFTVARSMVEWNDAPGRTQAEVVAALRSAATQARADAK